ncbi:MAG: glycosyltransferase, partial [Muribaculaceae bacterium]|nr:glycosyltransferase [Muribaculaceae bacterium]
MLKKRKKIGLVLANTPEYSETFFKSKIKGLVEAGNEVVLFAPVSNDFDKGEYADVNVVEPYRVFSNTLLQAFVTIGVVSSLIFRHPVRSARLVSLERRSGNDIGSALKTLYLNAHILPHSLDWLHFGFATMGLGRENVGRAIGAKVAVSFRGYDISIYPLKHPGCYDRLFKAIDKVHSISDDLYSQAVSLGLSPDISYQKITPAIDCSRFKKVHRTDGNINDPLRIVSVGRLTWKKGFDYALQALSALKKDFHYTIIGQGNDLERLSYSAYQLGILDKVTFAGKRTPAEISEMLQSCDIYLQPSVQEGFCNSVLEAQACGTICIVSDAEGLPENVENGKSGFVVAKRDPQAIVDTIIKV